MRHAGDDLAQGGQFAGLHQFVAQQLPRGLGAAALLDLAVQGQIGVVQFARAFVDAALQLQPAFFLRLSLGAGQMTPAQQHGHAQGQKAGDQQGQAARARHRRPDHPPFGRQQMQGPAGRGRIRLRMHPCLRTAVADGRPHQPGPVAVRRPEGQGGQGAGVEGEVGQAEATPSLVHRFGRAEAPFRDAGDQDDAAGIRHPGGFARAAPFGLQVVELDLQHNHAQGRAVR